MEEQSLYPTWLLVPLVPTELASLVWVNIRNARFCELRWAHSGWHIQNGWIPALIWGLFTMLNRFLLYGPTFSASPVSSETTSTEYSPHLKPQCYPIRELKLLVLNVVSPTEAEMQGKSFTPIDTHFKKEVEGVTHPETVVKTLENYMIGVIKRVGHASDHSQLIYERMKLIRLCLDGKERCSWDVEEKTKLTPQD
jgi:hypothetical protein